jgi:hypothetical protein
MAQQSADSIINNSMPMEQTTRELGMVEETRPYSVSSERMIEIIRSMQSRGIGVMPLETRVEEVSIKEPLFPDASAYQIPSDNDPESLAEVAREISASSGEGLSGWMTGIGTEQARRRSGRTEKVRMALRKLGKL